MGAKDEDEDRDAKPTLRLGNVFQFLQQKQKEVREEEVKEIGKDTPKSIISPRSTTGSNIVPNTIKKEIEQVAADPTFKIQFPPAPITPIESDDSKIPQSPGSVRNKKDLKEEKKKLKVLEKQKKKN